MEEHNEIMEETEIQAETPAVEGRDYASEVQALFAARPELRGGELPQQVMLDCVGGKRLTDAYNDYAKAQRQDAAALRRENRILRQNAKAAAQAPIRGVTRGGSAAAKPEDDFLKGFNSGW